MEKNDFLLYNEIVYRLHACRTMEELQPTLLSQLKLIIPYAYGSFIPIGVDGETGELVHRSPYCKPRAFEEAERRWVAISDISYTAWLSHAPESMVVRNSELLSGESRFSGATYGEIYQAYHIFDCMQVNATYAGRPMGRLALYRTREEGVFTEQEAFYLRALANHIDLACWHCLQSREKETGKSLEELVQAFGLTRREGEILGLVFQGWNNEEILEKLRISRNTLLKHLQNLYRKCGVSSRWDLLRLQGQEKLQKAGGG